MKDKDTLWILEYPRWIIALIALIFISGLFTGVYFPYAGYIMFKIGKAVVALFYFIELFRAQKAMKDFDINSSESIENVKNMYDVLQLLLLILLLYALQLDFGIFDNFEQ